MSEKQKLALDIIIGENVDIWLLKNSDTVETYNDMARTKLKLGQFQLLKEIAKYDGKPKKRYIVYVEKETRIRYSEPHKLVKNVAIEKLDGERLRDYFMYWFRADGSYGKCLKIIIKDKWNDNKEIYRGNNYEEFKEKCL